MKRVLWGLLAVGMFSMIMSCSDTSTGTGTSNESFGHLKMKIVQVDPDYYDVHGVLVKVFPETLPEDQKDCLNSSTSFELYEDLTWIPQPISDAIFVLASGFYKVCSIPVKGDKTTISDICGVAVKRKVEVVSEYVTEVTLESLCNANGGLDVITTFKDEPLIIGLKIDHPPGKFITTCESATMHVTADQTNAPLSYNWTFKPMPPPPDLPLFAKIDFIDGDATFTSNYVPPYDPNYKDNVFEITVTVKDNIGNTSSMTFPIHVRKCHPIYLGGSFTSANSPPKIRNRAAAVDPANGILTVWDPNLDAKVNAFLISEPIVYLAGDFITANASLTACKHAAAVDDIFGTLNLWDPNLDNSVDTLGIHKLLEGDTNIYLGGIFRNVNNPAQPRNRAAAVDAASALYKSWNPDLDNEVKALAISGSTIYLGGRFANYAIAVDDINGTLIPSWAPSLGAGVNALAVTEDTVYLGGLFTTSAGGNTYKFAEAVDKTTGVLISTWNPILEGGNVRTLAVVGHIVYLGGEMWMPGNVHHYLAAFDATTGAVINSWNPIVSAPVNTLAVCGSTVYFGGEFTLVNGVSRNYAAAVEAAGGSATGALTSWDPNLNDPVQTLTMECP